jgi:hypothetical protein
MIRHFSCLLVLVASLSAAPGASSPRSLRMVYVQAPDDAPEKIVLLVGADTKASREMDLPRMSVSTNRCEIPAGLVRVFAATKAPTRDDPLPANAPFVDIPEAMQAPLLVLLPSDGTGPLAFRMLPVDFSDDAAPDSSVVWFNLTERTVFARLGSAQVVVAPRRSGTVVPSGKVGDNYPVMVDLSPDEGEAETVPFLRARWAKDAGRRDLLFVFNDVGRKYPRLVCVPALKEPEAKEPNDKKRDPKKP